MVQNRKPRKKRSVDKLEDRFWAKIKMTDSCWLWTGAPTRGGYGRIKTSGHTSYAHRVSWELNIGPVPDGLCVLHKCDVPVCVSPSHLFLGTKADNNTDRSVKGRDRKSNGECNSAAKLTAAQVLDIRRRHGQSHTALAAEFGVSRSLVSLIREGKRWAHLSEEDS